LHKTIEAYKPADPKKVTRTFLLHERFQMPESVFLWISFLSLLS